MVTSAIGILVLLAGMIVTIAVDPATYNSALTLLSLPVGFIVSQIGLYFANRYVRSPRPDERLDEVLDKVAKNSRIYHYVIPSVPHVILTPAGPIVLVAKFQAGNITADGYKWTQKGLGFSRFFGQQGLGNPSTEAEYRVKQLAKFISRNAPTVAEKEIPMSAIIVFTTKDGGELDLKNSTIPALHYTKLRGFWKQRNRDEPLPKEDFEALAEAFDAAAGEDE